MPRRVAACRSHSLAARRPAPAQAQAAAAWSLRRAQVLLARTAGLWGSPARTAPWAPTGRPFSTMWAPDMACQPMGRCARPASLTKLLTVLICACAAELSACCDEEPV